MNKRTSDRHYSVADVMLISETLGIKACRLIDVSLGGICVDPEASRIPEDISVTVRFTLETRDGAVKCKAHALVMRSTDSECCLMFDGMDDRTHQALRSLVGDWQIDPRARGSSQIAAF